MTTFLDRADAGQQLAQHLQRRGVTADVIVALPRGGVPVAAQIARTLRAPMAVLPVRKLGLPQAPEVAMGALASGGVRWLNDALIAQLRVPAHAVHAVEAAETAELARREALYEGMTRLSAVSGAVVLLVDDGVATGATMRAGVLAVRARGALRVVVAVPVGAPDTCEDLRALADNVVCLHAPAAFRAVGLHYQHFPQLTDAEVHAALKEDPHA
ncbi:phosphoribosyltransferase (plasmid) [Deinococcus taeanensis]|uniref:phosphoribosyltransferase n=1 Tax=Deinococcus taeanensis TaxID=2737050 RepID=UPI001CDD8B98|nr:phosphoribosyltransferase family protein [Deinococcus taeanensis]UBV45065.1 phosphoribosyltransferase [Deinococcus taeanensis]